jgi:hypothetical protein
MCPRSLLPAVSARQIPQAFAARPWVVTGLMATLLISTAHAGQCSALAPQAQSPAFVDHRTNAIAFVQQADAPPADAVDHTAAPATVDPPIAAVGRPTGPDVQPCRHLPREQKLECLRRSAGTAEFSTGFSQ